MTLAEFMALDETDRAHAALAFGLVYVRSNASRCVFRLAYRVDA